MAELQHGQLLEKCKSEPAVRCHLIPERPSLKSLQTTNGGESVETGEPSNTVGGNVN